MFEQQTYVRYANNTSSRYRTSSRALPPKEPKEIIAAHGRCTKCLPDEAALGKLEVKMKRVAIVHGSLAA